MSQTSEGLAIEAPGAEPGPSPLALGGDAQHDPLPASSAGALAVGAVAIGAIALGAVAIGALAIGALAVGRLAIGQARIRKLVIDELQVGRITRLRPRR
jgi:hypothetical protein